MRRRKFFSRELLISGRKNRWFQLAIIIASAAVVLLVGIRIGYLLYKPKVSVVTPRDVTVQPSLSSQKKPAAQSSVCEEVSKAAVEKATGLGIKEIYASVSDTSTNEGMVAGCTYTVQDGQALRSVAIVGRSLKTKQSAQAALTQLTKGRADKIDQSTGQAYMIQDFQAVKLSDTKLYTVILAGAESKADAKQWLAALVSLL